MESIIVEVEKDVQKDILEECIELKNIKYKTMLMNGTVLSDMKYSKEDVTHLEKFLEDSKSNKENESWSKLDKTIKIKKLCAYAETYSQINMYTEEEQVALIAFLKDSLDRKKLQRIKDVHYDKEKCIITDIPALSFHKVTKHFTLKNVDKRINTIKSLSLPKKSNTTLRNKKDD
jgi:hypothetical protein